MVPLILFNPTSNFVKLPKLPIDDGSVPRRFLERRTTSRTLAYVGVPMTDGLPQETPSKAHQEGWIVNKLDSAIRTSSATKAVSKP